MAGESVVITWTVANWVTIFLMVVIGFLVIGAIAGLWNRARASSNANS